MPCGVVEKDTHLPGSYELNARRGMKEVQPWPGSWYSRIWLVMYIISQLGRQRPVDGARGTCKLDALLS